MRCGPSADATDPRELADKTLALLLALDCEVDVTVRDKGA